MKFSDIIGHKKNIELLKSFRGSSRVPHALLFTGKEGLGKRKTAVAFSAMLNCRAPSDKGACGQCSSCISLKNKIHPGIRFVASPKHEGKEIEIDFFSETISIPNIVSSQARDYLDRPGEEVVEEKEKKISLTVKININQIRELKRQCYLKSANEDEKKVFIIDDAGRISTQAMNSILKILEEPPANTHIILITSREEVLLPTVISRCQRIEFGPLSERQMKKFIKVSGIKAEKELLEISSGSPGKLQKLVDMGEFDIPAVKSENIFDAASGWALKDRRLCRQKLTALLEKEAAYFRKSPDEEGVEKIFLIEDAIRSLEKNANIDLTVSCLFLKLSKLGGEKIV